MITVLLDCDGPLANFCQGFLDLVEEETGYAFGPQVITDWDVTGCPYFRQLAMDIGRPFEELKRAVWKRVNRIGFCQSLCLIPGAKEAVKEIRKIAHVEVVTSPMGSSPTWMPERTEWLQRHFGFDSSEIHFVQKKFRVHGDVLVDDKTSHIVEWSNATHVRLADGHAILWDAPYNRGEELEGVRRASNWEQAVDHVRTIRNQLIPF